MEEFRYTDLGVYIKELQDSSDERLSLLLRDLGDRIQCILIEQGYRRMFNPTAPADPNSVGEFNMGLNGLVD